MRNMLLVLFLLCGMAANAAKLAVISDKGMENYADLLTAELSKQKDLFVIERAEINRVLKEQEISSTSSAEDYLKLGKLLNADGLVIIKKLEFQKKEFLASRLVAVNQGVVLSSFSNPCPPEKNDGWSADISAKFAPYFNKLNVSQEKAVPISILNIRAPIDTPEMRLLEKEFTLALAFRLVQEKDLFVLERWKMEKLAWEKSIDTESSNPFWTGSYLLDGGIELTDKENVKIKIRLKKTSGTEEIIEATGTRQKIDEITEKLTGDLLKQIGKTRDRIPWDSAKEAEQYLKEAEWACRSGLYDEAVASVENASALGLSGKEIIFARIKAYSMLAYPTFKPEMVPWDDLYVENIIDIRSTDKHLDAAIDALELFISSYLSEKPEGLMPTVKEWNDRQKLNWRYLGATVVMNASRVLRAYYDQKKYMGKADKLAVLRHLIRIVADDLLKRELKPGEKWSTPILLICSQYIPFWYESPQDSVNAYRSFFTIGFPTNSKLNDRVKFEAVQEYRKTPFIVDWTGRMSTAGLGVLIKDLMDELAKSGDLKEHMISLQWHKNEENQKLSDIINDKTIDDTQREILRGQQLRRMEDAEGVIRLFVWENRDELFFKNEIQYKFVIISFIQASRLYSPFCYNLLEYILDKCIAERIDLPYSTGSIIHIWMWRGTGKDEAIAIKKKLEDYRKSLDAASLKRQSAHFDTFNKKLKDFFPDIAPDVPSEGLASCKLWTPYQFESLKPGGNFRILAAVTRGGKIYLLSYGESMGERIIIFDLDRDKLDGTVELPDKTEHSTLMDVSDDYLIVIDGKKKVFKYERNRKVWSQQTLPQKNFTLMALKDDLLYLGYSDNDRLPDNGYFKDSLYQNCGILEADLKKDTYKVIASSTRKPAESPLDDTGKYNVLDIYHMKSGCVLFNVDVTGTEMAKDGKSKIIFVYDRGTGKLKQDFAHLFSRIIQISDNDFLMVSDTDLAIYHPDGSGLDYFYRNLSEKDKIDSLGSNRIYRLNENTYGVLKVTKILENPELIILNKNLPPRTIPFRLLIPSNDDKQLRINYHYNGFFDFRGHSTGFCGSISNELSTDNYIIFCGFISPGFWYIPKKDIFEYMKSMGGGSKSGVK